MDTTGLGGYDQLFMTPPDDHYCSFQLQACGVATVALSTILGITEREAYEFILDRGDTNRFRIISDGVVRREKVLSSLVGCNKESEDLVISWEHGHLLVGSRSDSNWTSLIDWTDTHPKLVNFVSFKTSSTDGTWTLVIGKGEYVCHIVSTPH